MARKRSNSHTVDFTGIEGKSSCPEGQGTFEVSEVTFEDNDDDGKFKWKWNIVDFECDDPKAKAPKTFSDQTSLGNSSLWNLRNRLEALGAEVPDGALDVDFDALVGLRLIATVIHKESGDRTYQNLIDYLPADDDKSSSGKKVEDEEEEEEVRVTSKKKKTRDVEEEEEEEEEEAPRKKKKAAPVEDEEEEEDEAPRKKKKAAPVEDEEEEEEAPRKNKKPARDEEEEEEEAPKKKKGKDVEKYTTDEVRDLDLKGLKALAKKHDIDIDFDEYSNLRKQAMALADMLDDAGLLED